jgi:hypothetical protein
VYSMEKISHRGTVTPKPGADSSTPSFSAAS